MNAAISRPLNVFVSYAHEDEELCHQLLKHLTQLQRDGVEGWYDRQISGGAEWVGAIDEHLNTADIILLLISTDFLASKYCYDVEMKRALERQEEDHARVVPVILRPCDWKNSPFVKFNVLPTDGKAVVDWKTLDHGFLNVVEGLRRVIAELRSRTSSVTESAGGEKPAFRNFPKVRPLRWAAVAALSVLPIVAAGLWWSRQQQYVAQGEASLDLGRYAKAQESFQQALRWNPWRTEASLGSEEAKLYDLMAKPVEFQQKLDQLTKEEPKDAHLKILEGDFQLSLDQRDKALGYYQKAAELNPQAAEAYFRMCVLYGIEGNRSKALDMCQKAVEHSPLSPQYRANLAAQYFERGEYPEAVRQYQQVVDGYPLAKLELAKIRRLQSGGLDEAREKEQSAIEDLQNDKVMASLPENSLPWIFQVSQTEAVSVPSNEQKLCYAYLELSATGYLLGAESQSAESADRAAKACGSQTRDVKAAVDWELARVADERNELAPKVDRYRRGPLATWGSPRP